MFIIWRGMGWLILPFILLAWWLADGVILPIYRGNTGFEYVYNAEKGVMGGVAMIVVAVIIALFVLFVQRPLERQPTTEEGWAEWEAKKRAELVTYAKVLADGNVPLDAERQAQLDGAPIPRPAKRSSSFFFIPMWVFPILFAVIGIVMIAMNVGTAVAEVAVREG